VQIVNGSKEVAFDTVEGLIKFLAAHGFAKETKEVIDVKEVKPVWKRYL